MGIFKKIGDLARANLNAWLSQVEDKKKLFEQKILDLEESKKKAHKLLISSMAAVKLAEQNKARIKRKIEMQHEAAKRSKKDDEKALNVEEEKQDLIRESQIYDETIEKEHETISTINLGLKAIDEKITSIKNTTSQAVAQETIDDDNAFTTFSRMEEKIEMREKEVEALEELLSMNENKDGVKNTSFDEHSDPSALEKELEKIKKKLTK